MAGFWRKCRIGFRWFRLTVWLVVLTLVCTLAWFDKVGLPGFLKVRLVAALQERGVRLDFSRLQLRLLRGIVAENVSANQSGVTGGPALAAREVQLHLDWAALWHRQLQVSGFLLRDGTITWPLTPATPLTVTNLQLNLRFGPDDTWTLEHCTATVAGTRLGVDAEISHATQMARWNWSAGKPVTPAPAAPAAPEFPARLEQLVATLEKIKLSQPPELKLTVQGDAQNISSFDLRLTATVPAAVTPWGRFEQTALTAEARPLRLDYWPQFNVRLTSSNAITPWGSLNQGLLTLAAEAVPLDRWPALTVQMETARARAAAPRGEIKNFRFDAQITTNDAPALTTATLTGNPGGWTNLAPWRLTWQTRMDAVQTPELAAREITADGAWQFPGLSVNHLTARLGGGSLTAGASWNVATRELHFSADSRCDPHALNRLLPPQTRDRLAQVTWAEPPVLRLTGQLVIPATAGDDTNLLSALAVQGEFAFTNMTVANLPVDVACSHFACSHLVWQLPDLQLASGRTKLGLHLAGDGVTGQFTGGLAGRFDPDSLRPLFPQTNAAGGFAICTFTEPLALDAAIQGDLRNLATLSATGHLAATNFAVRGQWIENVAAAFDYRGLIAHFFNPRLARASGSQIITADRVTLDLNTRWIWFTNGFSTAEPMVAARAIGPKTARTVEPYQFLAPPTARVNGGVALQTRMDGDREVTDADLTFEVLQPAPFRWERLASPQLTGTIHWLGQILILTNMSARFYDGDSRGWAVFDFRPAHPGADYRFSFTVTNADLHLLATDLDSPTNRLEGRLSGWVDITNASTETVESWQGRGHAVLRDGLIWDIPVFGILSPVLNKVSPGLGNNRATEAAADFITTNGVLATDSLIIRSTMSRVEYRGTINLQQQVDARVTLEMLRNTPLLGYFISTALRPLSKVFEYRVTGSLGNPRTTPVYVPEIFLFPLHPFRTMGDLFTPSSANTNTPAH